MSKVYSETINCPKCNKELNVNIYSSINVNFDSELKDKLLNGELTNVPCDCGLVISLNYPILYHKIGCKDVMIQYTNSDIETTKRKYEEARKFINTSFINPFGLSLKQEEIFEIYNNWGEFTKRIKEIG